MSVIAFTKVAFPYGWMGNMAPFPITYQKVPYRTTEALFQCLRFPNEPKIQRAIRDEKSPMGAKMRAKAFRSCLESPICDAADLERMALCLRLKCQQHPQLRNELLRTGEAEIIEDCTARSRDIEIDGKNHAAGLPFWGARWEPQDQSWHGKNALGVLWMKLRSQLRGKAPPLPMPDSFIGHLFSSEPKPIMKSFNDRKEALKTELASLDKLETTYNKVEATVKQAGYSSLDEFIALVKESEEPATPARKNAGKSQTGGVKRPRITDEQLVKMKVLRSVRKLSQTKVAKKLGISLPSVSKWEKKGFTR